MQRREKEQIMSDCSVKASKPRRKRKTKFLAQIVVENLPLETNERSPLTLKATTLMRRHNLIAEKMIVARTLGEGISTDLDRLSTARYQIMTCISFGSQRSSSDSLFSWLLLFFWHWWNNPLHPGTHVVQDILCNAPGTHCCISNNEDIRVIPQNSAFHIFYSIYTISFKTNGYC